MRRYNSAIYCWKSDVASHLLAFGFTQLTALVALCKQYIFSTEKKMNKCIRMGITAFKFVIGVGGGKSAALPSEISFYGDASP